MNKEIIEDKSDALSHVTVSEGGHEGKTELSYEGYVSCGGIINREDYESALSRASVGNASEVLARHAENIAKHSGMSLDALQSEIDPRVLYSILRKDVGAQALEHHHSQMSDQKLFVEMLRMLQKDDAVRLVQNAYPSIFY